MQQDYRAGYLCFAGVLTGRTAIRAAFINADNATEYLVYAHGASGIKDVMDQVTNTSSRIAGEQNLKIAYDNNLPNQGVSWSFKCICGITRTPYLRQAR